MELGYLLINGHWGALGTHLHATWDILALVPTPSLNMPLVYIFILSTLPFYDSTFNSHSEDTKQSIIMNTFPLCVLCHIVNIHIALL